MRQFAKIALIVMHTIFSCNLTVHAQNSTANCNQLIAAEVDGYEPVDIGNLCLWKKIDRIEGTVEWKHPIDWSNPLITESLKFARPINLFFKINKRQQLNLTIYLVTRENMKFDKEVKVWHTGMEVGTTIFDGEFMSTEELSMSIFTNATDRMINLLNGMAEAEEAIIRFRTEDVELSQTQKSYIKDMLYIWENHKEKLKK